MILLLVQGGPKNRLFLRADNFATVNGRKACDIYRILSRKNIYINWVKFMHFVKFSIISSVVTFCAK